MATDPAPDLPPDWAEAIRAILSGPPRRVLVLGPADVGKSTFCHALMAAAGERAQLLDADLGQKTVGPPATLTLSRPGAPDALASLAFVGTTSPLKGARSLLDGVGRLAAEASADLLVANTGGLLSDGGRWLKRAKADALRPGLIVAIGVDPALDAILGELSAIPARRLGPSPLARRKTAAGRRAARAEAFRRNLDGAALRRFRPAAGAPLCERQLVGIRAGDGRDLAVGIVTRIAPDGVVEVLSPAPAGPGRVLVPGRLRLDADCGESPLPKPGPAASPP